MVGHIVDCQVNDLKGYFCYGCQMKGGTINWNKSLWNKSADEYQIIPKTAWKPILHLLFERLRQAKGIEKWNEKINGF